MNSWRHRYLVKTELDHESGPVLFPTGLEGNVRFRIVLEAR